jgi:death-on-curing protein
VSTRYLTIDDVLEFHAVLLDRFGGIRGVRDRGALEAAVARPQSGYCADVIEAAAGMWESLSQNHPFLDGNKRVAIAAAMVFLRINGYRATFSDFEAYAWLMERYETGAVKKPVLEEWLRAHVHLR